MLGEIKMTDCGHSEVLVPDDVTDGDLTGRIGLQKVLHGGSSGVTVTLMEIYESTLTFIPYSFNSNGAFPQGIFKS